MISLSKPLAFGLLAVACLVAAAGGGYLATRYNALPSSPADASTRVAEQASPGFRLGARGTTGPRCPVPWTDRHPGRRRRQPDGRAARGSAGRNGRRGKA